MSYIIYCMLKIYIKITQVYEKKKGKVMRSNLRTFWEISQISQEDWKWGAIEWKDQKLNQEHNRQYKA